jgi:hypothetical protein
MRPPDPARPVLFPTSRALWIYRYGVPALFLGLLVCAPWIFSPAVREELSVLALPGVVLLAWLLLYSAKLRRGFVTDEGITLREAGSVLFFAWTDLDWAVELAMNPPTLVVRVKRGVPAAPLWFLLLPPRERSFRWSVQPMSEYVARQVRDARAASPERALEYTPWPSRIVLTLKVHVPFFLSILAALALSFWIEFGELPGGGRNGGGAPTRV